MKLWVLSRTDDGPRSPVYDCYDGHVIAAATEDDARVLASARPGDEGKDAWLNPARSTVEHIGESATEVEGIILSDFHAG